MAVLDNIKITWQSYNQVTRGFVIAGIVIIISVFLYLLFLMFFESKATLFSDLEPRDASAIVKELEKMKVKYKMEDGGRKIVVDNDIVHKTRAKIIGSGVNLSGGVGFEIFDKDKFGTTEFAQKINLQRAMQGELARTIMAFDAIKLARVHLVFPDTSLFKKNKQNASASVTVFFKQGHKFTEQQIEGVKQLVASSVPGLSLKDVSVIDQNGIILKSNDDEFNLSSASLRLEKKKEIENYMISKAQRILDQVFGAGKALVTVDVSLDFNNANKRIEHVDNLSGDNATIVHKRESKTSKNGTNEDKSTNSNMEIDYLVGKSVENIISTPGTITRLTVAVLLPDGIGFEVKNEITSLISGTIGIDEKRGDLISVVSGANNSSISVPTKPRHEVSKVRLDETEKQPEVISIFDSRNSIVIILEHFIKEQFRLLAFLFLSMILILITLLIYVRRIKKENKTVILGDSLTNDQRQKLLSEIQSWIDHESDSEKKIPV